MDIKAIKQKLNALQSTGQKKEKVDYSKYLWKPKSEGKYQIRIVPSVLNKSNPFQEVYPQFSPPTHLAGIGAVQAPTTQYTV